jgi:uncharacterized protein YceH (UPF0502 family)
MSTAETTPTDSATSPPRWQPLEPTERRVLGVLVEKAKTTPENYPLTLNSLRNGCNQKNNRSPLTQLAEEQVEDALEALRKVGAVTVIQGDGRVEKYRHRAYEWMGVEKVELAVMAELLLRGAQTIGELRGRAARMEPIKDLGELRPVLDSLEAKRLIQYLTPQGRGSVVTHTLYQDRELEKVRREALQIHGGELGDDEAPPAVTATRANENRLSATVAVTSAVPQSDGWRAEASALRQELANIRSDLQASKSDFEQLTSELRSKLDELNRQLGN